MEKPRWWPMTPGSPRLPHPTQQSWAHKQPSAPAQKQGRPLRDQGQALTVGHFYLQVPTTRRGETLEDLQGSQQVPRLSAQSKAAAGLCTPSTSSVGKQRSGLQLSMPCGWQEHIQPAACSACSALLWWTHARSKDEAWIKRCHEYSPLPKSVFCNQDRVWERSNLTVTRWHTGSCGQPGASLHSTHQQTGPLAWFSATENNQPSPLQSVHIAQKSTGLQGSKITCIFTCFGGGRTRLGYNRKAG